VFRLWRLTCGLRRRLFDDVELRLVGSGYQVQRECLHFGSFMWSESQISFQDLGPYLLYFHWLRCDNLIFNLLYFLRRHPSKKKCRPLSALGGLTYKIKETWPWKIMWTFFCAEHISFCQQHNNVRTHVAHWLFSRVNSNFVALLFYKHWGHF